MQRLISSQFLCAILGSQIKLAWDKLPVPCDEPICKPQASALFTEPMEIEKWVKGKKFDEIVLSNNFENYMPFYYMTDSVTSYYIGAYLLNSCQNLSLGADDLNDDFGFIHLSAWISSGGFYKIFHSLSNDCATACLGFFEILLLISDQLELDSDLIYELQKILTLGLTVLCLP